MLMLLFSLEIVVYYQYIEEYLYIASLMKDIHKIHSIKNKKIRIIWAIICLMVLVSFIAWVIIWTIWWYNYDLLLMKLWIWISIISWIFMWILHILYFRTPKKFRKILHGE